jgi:hypothetical protein
MWQAIQYVGSGLTLAAFVVAVVAWVVKSKSEERERLIGSAGERERADLVRDALEFFRVDTSGLTKTQQYQLALEQIRARAQRFRIVAIVVCTIAVLGAGIATYSIVRSNASSTSGAQVVQAEKKPLTLLASIWKVELESKGSLVGQKEFSAGLGGISETTLQELAEWVSNQLGLPARKDATPTPKVHLKVQIPADLTTEKPIIQRIPDGKMDVLLWDVRGSAKSRLPLTWEALKDMQTPFQLEVRIPGSGTTVIEVTPGTALTKEMDLGSEVPAPAPVNVGVEKFSGLDDGITERVCSQLSSNPLIKILNPDMLEAVRKQIEAQKEMIRSHPMAQMSLRSSYGIEYIISGSVQTKTR